MSPAASDNDIKVFHAGTADVDSQLCTSGGRVLCVTALGVDIPGAQHAAYDAVACIHWPGMTFRRDIGWRAVDR